MLTTLICLCMADKTIAEPLFTTDATAGELSETSFIQPFIRRQNGLEVRAEKVYLRNEGAGDYFALDMSIDNRTGRTVTLAITDVFVNDCRVLEKPLSAPVRSGETQHFTLGLAENCFQEFGIEHILWMDFDTTVYSGDGTEILYEGQRSRLETSQMGNYVQSYEFPGQVLYDGAAARISMKNTLREISSGTVAVLFVSNRMDSDIEVEFTFSHINEVSNVELTTSVSSDAGMHSGAYLPIPKEMLILFIRGGMTSAELSLEITSQGRLIDSVEGIPVSFQ